MKRVLLFGAFMLTACGKPEDDSALKAAFAASSLKDPSSVQLRNVKANSDVICGEYNSKNSYGAYSGFQLFVFKRSIKSLWLADSDSLSASPFWKECPNANELGLVDLDATDMSAHAAMDATADMNATDDMNATTDMNGTDTNMIVMNATDMNATAEPDAGSDDAPIPDNYVYDANNDAGE